MNSLKKSLGTRLVCEKLSKKTTLKKDNSPKSVFRWPQTLQELILDWFVNLPYTIGVGEPIRGRPRRNHHMHGGSGPTYVGSAQDQHTLGPEAQLSQVQWLHMYVAGPVGQQALAHSGLVL